MSGLNSTPKRALTNNFTKRTMRRSLLAKKRLERMHRLKGFFTMNKIGFLKHPAGALIAIAFIVVSGAGVYAAMNWFNGSTKITSDNSIMTVDLSECESGLPPGGVLGADPKNIQFKILGTPHIEPEILQQRLLAQCEFDSAMKFLGEQAPAVSLGYQASKVKAIDAYSITLETTWGGKKIDKVFNITPETTIYNQTNPAKTDDLKIGDSVVYTYALPSSTTMENENALGTIDTVKSIFKTQYDVTQMLRVTKAHNAENNIMPLELYNQIHKK